MKTFNNFAAQGDFVIMRVDSFPDGLEPIIPENTLLIIAHSETGHNHVMVMDHVEAYKKSETKNRDLYEIFLLVKKPTEIVHQRLFDTHESIMTPPGNYIIKRQREYIPEGFRRAAD